jgi:hypothetical protein
MSHNCDKMKNRNVVHTLFIILILITCTSLVKGQAVKLSVIEYLIKIGDLNPTDDKHKCDGNIFIVELTKYVELNNQKIGVFKFGTYSDHSKTYLLLKEENEFQILDMQKLDEVLKTEIAFLKKNKKPPNIILKYIEATIAEYQKNLKAIPWTE